jgi:hypothetical protein
MYANRSRWLHQSWMVERWLCAYIHFSTRRSQLDHAERSWLFLLYSSTSVLTCKQGVYRVVTAGFHSQRFSSTNNLIINCSYQSRKTLTRRPISSVRYSLVIPKAKIAFANIHRYTWDEISHSHHQDEITVYSKYLGGTFASNAFLWDHQASCLHRRLSTTIWGQRNYAR